MQPLSSLPARTLLLEYAHYLGRDHLQHLTRFLRQLGYVAVTRKHPMGRLVTPADVRHLLDKWLKEFPAYPLHRAPKERDFLRIKVQILEKYDEGDMR